MGEFLLVFSAIVCGWLLGRYAWVRRGSGSDGYRRYYRGLNYLLNEQPDEAIDSFIQSLEVNGETLDTHLAVGNLMRRKGEVERAIKIHQNLLSRPNLPAAQQHQAHLELARDFVSAGLLDRAERLLLDLINQSPALREISQQQLMELYQDEREWQRAIDVGQALLPRRGRLLSSAAPNQQVLVAVAHYHCELAELALLRNDYHTARSQLKKALQQDRGCARASLLAGKVEFRTGHLRQAVRILRRVRDQDPALLPEVIDTLRSCHYQLGEPEAYRQFLLDCLNDYPSTLLLLAVAEELRTHQGQVAALDFLKERLSQRPTLRGVTRLIELLRLETGSELRDGVALLQQLLDQLLLSKPNYQCHHCGFAGRSLHWLCPSCKQWNTIKPIRGLEGD